MTTTTTPHLEFEFETKKLKATAPAHLTIGGDGRPGIRFGAGDATIHRVTYTWYGHYQATTIDGPRRPFVRLRRPDGRDITVTALSSLNAAIEAWARDVDLDSTEIVRAAAATRAQALSDNATRDRERAQTNLSACVKLERFHDLVACNLAVYSTQFDSHDAAGARRRCRLTWPGDNDYRPSGWGHHPTDILGVYRLADGSIVGYEVEVASGSDPRSGMPVPTEFVRLLP